MSTPILLSSLLNAHVPPEIANKLSLLDRLAGKFIGSANFYADVNEIRDQIENWMPVFFVPIAQEAFRVGLHLRPSDIASKRLAIMRANDDGQMIEIANSIDQFVYRALLEEEGYGNDHGKPLRAFAQSVDQANEVFGPDFYSPGRHGKFSKDAVDQVMVDVFGGTAYAFYVEALFEEDLAKRLPTLEKGIAVEPGCMALYALAVETLLELGDRSQAAKRFAASLECYHHTLYTQDLNELFDRGRPLLDEFPEFFTDDQRWVVNEDDQQNWVRRAAELYKSGDVERADKVLNDLCSGMGDFSASIGAFRKHYEKLGWSWALALCDLRHR